MRFYLPLLLLNLSLQPSASSLIVYDHCLELAILDLDVILFVTFLDLVACQLSVQHLCSLPLVIKLRLKRIGLALHQLDLLAELLLELTAEILVAVVAEPLLGRLAR